MIRYTIQTSLFYCLGYFLTIPINRKYHLIFSNLDLSGFPNINRGVGATGFPRHAMLRALIIKTLENIPSIPRLIWFMENNPVLCDLCGFQNHALPDETQFYRLLKYAKHSLLEDLLVQVNKMLLDLNAISLKQFAVDSKPIVANTKENNHKNLNRNLKRKHRKPRRNRYATLSYYSCRMNSKGKRVDPEFFWGYRNHAIVDVESGICLIETTVPNNRPDAEVAETLIRKLKKKYRFRRGAIFIGDKAYDANHFYNFIVKQMKSQPIIPLNPRNTKREIVLSDKGHRICEAGLEMYPNGKVVEEKRTRLKERCPIKMNKKIAKKHKNRCPVNHEKFVSGKQYGCTAYIDLAGDLRASVERDTLKFKTLSRKRFPVERCFSQIQMLDVEDTPYYSPRSIKNHNALAYLSLSLIAFAAVKAGRKKDMHRYRTFVP